MSEQPEESREAATSARPAAVRYDVHVAAFADLDAPTGYRLWQLRESVFVVEQACPYQELDGRDLEPGTRHLWVSVAPRDDDEAAPVAYLRLLEEPAGPVGVPAETSYRIGRVLVAPAHRGRGLAALLMRSALDIVGDRPSRLDAQSYLSGWYERFGYVVTGAEFLDDGIPHLPMVRELHAREAREV